MIIREIQAKSILNKSKIFDYCLNPYTGCQTSCQYCYARLFMPRYSGHKEPWGEFVDVKVNAVDLLRRQLERAKKGTVWISSVCDPYQSLEAKYRLTRGCLEELLKKQFPVNIQTKSKLVLRDLDLIRQFAAIDVGFTIATDDETIAKLFEPKASPVRERIKALGIIHDAGVRTFAFIGPLLPGNPEKLANNLTGKVDYVYIDRMNYSSAIRNFYRHHGLEEALNDNFFRKYRDRLVREMEKKGIAFEVLFQ
ncbi:MAG: radical SAM protein [Candidatus Aminicenantes bacterium]|nr:MAG: radical SAM protein [Candidatus Aminicenantes bacterium]